MMQNHWSSMDHWNWMNDGSRMNSLMNNGCRMCSNYRYNRSSNDWCSFYNRNNRSSNHWGCFHYRNDRGGMNRYHRCLYKRHNWGWMSHYGRVAYDRCCYNSGGGISQSGGKNNLKYVCEDLVYIFILNIYKLYFFQ